MYLANRTGRIDYEERTITPAEQLSIGQERVVKKVAYGILGQIAMQLNEDL